MTPRLIETILNLLYPRTCLKCGNFGTYICPKCYSQINFQTAQKCPLCNRFSPQGATHAQCSTPHSIDGIYAISQKDPLTTKFITLLKYQFVTDLTSTISQIIIHHLPQFLTSPDMIAPIPLHPKRLHWRGFNQSELLSREIAKHTNRPHAARLLIRRHHTKPQAEIANRNLRKTNLNKAFQLNPNFNLQLVQNQHILLIDDVTTTGATLSQAAIPLKRAKATSVWGLVFCR